MVEYQDLRPFQLIQLIYSPCEVVMTKERNKPVHQSPRGTPDTPAGDKADTDDDRVGPAPIPGGCDMTEKNS